MLKRIFGFLMNKENLIYIIFGVLTTIVNWAVYLPLYYSLALSATVSHMISWAFSVIFAYLTNKVFVFKSHKWSPKIISTEFVKFVSGRLLTGAVEGCFLALMVDYFCFNGFLWKLIASIISVILNYVISKLFIFNTDKCE